MSKLESFGPTEEIVEAILYIGIDDEKGANRLLKKALDAGVKFSGAEIGEIWLNCEETELNRAIRLSADTFTKQDIEDLYCFCDDDLLLEVAKKRKLKTPDGLYDYDEETEEDAEELSEAADPLEEPEEKLDAGEALSPAEIADNYDYVLQLLLKAHEHTVQAYKLGIADTGSKKRALSILKHACLLEAQPYIDDARTILEEMEVQVSEKLTVRNTRLNLGKMIVFHDTIVDGFITDWIVQRRIRKILKELEAAIKDIQKLRKQYPY
jgi:hypothetical protein